MIRIRRAWLLSAALFTFVVYYISYHTPSNGAPFLPAGRRMRPSDAQANLVPEIDLSKIERISPGSEVGGKTVTGKKTSAQDAALLSEQLSKQYHLAPRPDKYPVTSHIPLPTGVARDIPRIQFDFASHPQSSKEEKTRLNRRAKVRAAFQHAWKGYKKYAWAKDEVMPLSGESIASFGGWGATLVDAMDTLWMMEMKDDFEQCVKHVEQIDFTTNTEQSLNVFETTIRYLGGILAAYDVSEHKYPSLLKKATELGDILMMVFDTPTRMPIPRWNWRKTASGGDLVTGGSVLIAELGSMDLEMTRLSQLTGDDKYFDAIQRISQIMYEAQNSTHIPGLWPTYLYSPDVNTSSAFTHNSFTFGGMADSAYEYLPKEYLLLGGLDTTFQQMYESAIDAAKQALFFRPFVPDADILFSGDAMAIGNMSYNIQYHGQHLTCFVGGMVGIGSKIFKRPEDLSIARKLTDGCVWAYDAFPHGVMPERFTVLPCHDGVTAPEGVDCKFDVKEWHSALAAKQYVPPDSDDSGALQRGAEFAAKNALPPGFAQLPDNRYILRPEAIESVLMLYRITGDPKFMEDAWRMFNAIEKATRTKIAHAGIMNVNRKKLKLDDKMESFWLAETLKYFYLMFEDPEKWSLDDWVYNTEAHPLRRPKAGEKLRLT